MPDGANETSAGSCAVKRIAATSNCENATATTQYVTVRQRRSKLIHTMTVAPSASSVCVLPRVAATSRIESVQVDWNDCSSR